MDWISLWPVLAGGLGRSVLGWLENAFGDGKIEAFEWKQLGETILRIGTLAVALIAGLHVDPASAAGLGVGADFLFSSWQAK